MGDASAAGAEHVQGQYDLCLVQNFLVVTFCQVQQQHGARSQAAAVAVRITWLMPADGIAHQQVPVPSPSSCLKLHPGSLLALVHESHMR